MIDLIIMDSKRTEDRRSIQTKYSHKNMRRKNRRNEDSLDQNIYRFIMISIPLILIVWSLNLK